MTATRRAAFPASGPAAWPPLRPPPQDGGEAGGFTGILDRLATAPVAAWSVARVLRAAWRESPLIRLRRASDNAESDFGADPETGNLDTAAVATWIGGSSAFVVKVYDQSGSGAEWAQTVAGSQPAYSATALSGLPGWMGSTDFLECDEAVLDNLWTGGGAMHLVWGITNDPVNDKFVWKGYGASGGWDFVGSSAAAPNTKAILRIAGASGGTCSPGSSTARVNGGFYAETISVGAALTVGATAWRTNGAAETVATISNDLAGGAQDDSAVSVQMPYVFGASANPSGGELILFASALSSGDLQKLNDDATDYYEL